MADPEKALPDLHKIFDRMFSKPAQKPAPGKQVLFERSKRGPPKPRLPTFQRTAQRLSSARSRVPLFPPARPSKQIVGVDLSASAIKVVCVEESQVIDAAFEEIPSDLPEPERKTFRRNRLRDLKRRGLLRGRLVMGVAEDRMAVESVTMPAMPAADLEKAVLWEAKEKMAAEPPAHCIRHLVVDEAMVDGQTQKEVMIFSVPRDEIISSYSMIAGYGSRVSAAEPGILAAVAALEVAGFIQPERFVGVLDIGFKRSTLALVVDGKVRFVRAFSIAGESFTQNIVQYCKLTMDEAETQKRQMGLPQIGVIEDKEVSTEATLQVGNALSLNIEQLATEMDHSLRYVTYYSLGRAKAGRMEKLYLIGGGALLRNLPGFLEARLDTRVEIADPFRSVAVSEIARAKLSSLETRVRLATALGLALRPAEK